MFLHFCQTLNKNLRIIFHQNRIKQGLYLEKVGTKEKTTIEIKDLTYLKKCYIFKDRIVLYFSLKVLLITSNENYFLLWGNLELEIKILFKKKRLPTKVFFYFKYF